MNERSPPPPVLDSARVLTYAFVDDIPYQRAGALYVSGVLLEAVPRLAICANLGRNIGVLLFHCDDEWNVLGTSGGEDVEGVKKLAERNYPGVSARWMDLNTSIEVALEYYDEQAGRARCSFCSKRPFEIDGWIEGDNARICYGCIKQLFAVIEEGGLGETRDCSDQTSKKPTA